MESWLTFDSLNDFKIFKNYFDDNSGLFTLSGLNFILKISILANIS